MSEYSESWMYKAAADDAEEAAYEDGWRWIECPHCGNEGYVGHMDHDGYCFFCGKETPRIELELPCDAEVVS